MPTEPTGLPQYAIGRLIKNVKITGVAIAPLTGNVTKGTSYDIGSSAIATLDGVRFELNTDTVEISAANASIRNYVATKGDFTAEVTEIKSNNGGATVLGTFINSSFFLVEVIVSQDGGTTNAQLIQMICIATGMSDEYQEGKMVNVLSGKAAGLPIYVGVPSGAIY